MESRLKRKRQSVEGEMLHNLRRTNPKAFYRRFSRRRISCCKEQLPAIVEHFRDLSGMPTTDEAVDTDIDSKNTVFHELDADITSDEIRQCIKGLKWGVSHGDDCILNEFLIEFCDILLPFL